MRSYTKGKALLPDTHPHIAEEWHPTKNEGLFPHDVTPGSAKKVWWLGECRHEWDAVIANRCNLNSGCPICAGKRILIGFNDLMSKNPLIASEWHPTKNGNLKPADVTNSSNKTVWWLAECGHEWEAKVLTRTLSKTNCKVCFGRTILPGVNDLKTKYPEVAKDWHPSKNEKFDILTISPSSKQKVWWMGDCSHEWEATIQSRTGQFKAGCHVCSSKDIQSGINDFSFHYPDIAKEWHPTLNHDLSPDSFARFSSAKIWWQCEKNHTWEATIANRTFQNQGCPYCSGQRVDPGVNDLLTINPKLAGQWHPTLNDSLRPSDVMPQSSQKVWWIGTCGHQWESAISSRARKNAKDYCPNCVQYNLQKGISDLESFSPQLAKEWVRNNTLKPSEVSFSSGYKAEWVCQLGHTWKATVSNRIKGNGCPTCGGKLALPGFNDLEFLNPILAQEWHPHKNGLLKPNSVTLGSGRKIWWQCKKGHDWQANIVDRANRHKTGCPQCNANNYVSKAEKEIVDYLVDKGIHVDPSNRKILRGAELDLYIPSHNMAIEYNGLFYHTERSGKDRNYHYNKWFQCKQLGIQLIQVWENDWNKDKELVKKMLLHKLRISNDRKVFARKTNVSMVNTAVAKEFLEANHIQGFASGSAYIALIEKNVNDSDPVKIVALMTLKKEQEKLNIVRYATSCNVVGGFSKILRYVENNFEYDLLYTFSDHCISDGSLYANNGFIADKELPPDYKYHVNGDLKHKFGYRLKRFREDPSLLWEEGLTERQLAELNGIERIWDAGKTRWIKPKI